MNEWGEAISVDGKRPEWLRDDDMTTGRKRPYSPPGEWPPFNLNWRRAADVMAWENVLSFRLPATHPYYAVQRYNAEHGTAFTYWPGGDAAPEDWSGDRNSAIDADGRIVWPDADSPNWGRIEKDTPYQGRLNIVGYLRRSEPKSTYDPSTHVAVKRMTEVEAQKVWMLSRSGLFEWLTNAGILIPEPTEAERIAAKTGLDLATVTAVLDAREGE